MVQTPSSNSNKNNNNSSSNNITKNDTTQNMNEGWTTAKKLRMSAGTVKIQDLPDLYRPKKKQ